MPVSFGDFPVDSFGREDFVVVLLVVVAGFFLLDGDSVEPFHGASAGDAGCDDPDGETVVDGEGVVVHLGVLSEPSLDRKMAAIIVHKRDR